PPPVGPAYVSASLRRPPPPPPFPYTTLFRSGTIPPEATAPILVIVGYFMMTIVKDINFGDPAIGIPALLTILMQPLTFSITNGVDRKSTRLNSSHEWISYAVFCLKKKRRIYDYHFQHEMVQQLTGLPTPSVASGVARNHLALENHRFLVVAR